MLRELELAAGREEAFLTVQAGPVLLGEWLERYLDHAQTTNGPETYSEKRACYKRFVACFRTPDVPVAEITAAHALKYLQK